jgi:3-hydroxyacyl-CoA dehydrogenase
VGASEPRPPPPVAIVGAGSIGVGWAIVFARAGHPVRIHDPDAARLAVVPDEIASRLDALASFDLLPDHPAVVLGRIAVLAGLEPTVDGCLYVQECAPEDVDLKRELFLRLDAAAPSGAVLASSSSMLPASRFAGDVPGRGRCLVAHPGNPPYLLPVVELVPAPFTSEEALERAAETLESAWMSVVRVHAELEGFVFNRLQGALLREAYCLVRDGVASVEDVDRVVREGLGRRWAVVGPFETADLNTRGGIEAHARRMGPAYARMGAERGQSDPWAPELVEQVTSERRRLLPLEEWEDRVVWRDRMLMRLDRARQEPERSAREEADRREITTVLHGYCRMLDSLELERVLSYFTDDCEVIYGPEPRMQSHGAAHLAESLRRLSRFARTSHHLSNVEIELTGPESATSISYVLAWHQQPDGASRTVYGQYHDRFVRTAAGWRIAERRQLTNGTDVPWDLPLTEAPRRSGAAR